MFAQTFSETIHFDSTLQEAIQKLYYHDYFSYLCRAYQLKHWGLINQDQQITTKGIRFCRGEIGIEKSLHLSPRFPKDPDPDIHRGDSFVFYSGNGHANT